MRKPTKVIADLGILNGLRDEEYGTDDQETDEGQK